MHPLVVAPQRITESTLCETRMDARFVPKKADAPFFKTIVSSSRGSRRGSISTQWPPTCKSPSVGTFSSQRPPSFRPGSKPIDVNTTGSPFARATSSRRFVDSTSAVSSEPSAHEGSVKPQLKSTTSTTGREPSVTLSPKRAFFTHICHDLSHVRTESTLPPHVRLAYDGLEIEAGLTRAITNNGADPA